MTTMEEDIPTEREHLVETGLTTNFTFEKGKTPSNFLIDQVDENHFMYRRGSTQVHIQTYAPSSTSGVMEEDKMENIFLRASNLMSALLGLIIIMMTLVIKLANAITDQMSNTLEDEYMLSLYVGGFVWNTYYNLKGTCKYQNEIKFSKSNQSSNRWLKGVVVLFGFAIVLKDGLEFITFVMGDTSQCLQNRLEATLTFFHGLFIISQVKYLFRFSKVYIRNCSAGSRTGLMYIIAVNLSTWIAAVVDETLNALEKENMEVEVNPTPHEEYFSTLNSTESLYDQMDSDHEQHSCQCHSTFCETVDVADNFLFPFVIEFTLVASCMLYDIWSNIEKYPPLCEKVVKPSYKFYKKYTGSLLGGVAFFLTIVFLILLDTSGSSVDESERNYFTQNGQLLLHDGFLVGLEVVMLLATLMGFYLFHKIRRPLEKASMLDQVLLIVCLLGPLALNIFSMIAVVVGPDNKTTAWILTLFHPLVDVLQCLFQLMFVLYGLKREPITSANAKETNNQLRFGIQKHIHPLGPSVKKSSEGDWGLIKMAYLKRRRSSITSIASRLANIQPDSNIEQQPQATLNEESHHDLVKEQSKVFTAEEVEATSFNLPEILISQPEDENAMSDENKTVTETQCHDDEEQPQNSVVKIVSESKVTRPNKLRDGCEML